MWFETHAFSECSLELLVHTTVVTFCFMNAKCALLNTLLAIVFADRKKKKEEEEEEEEKEEERNTKLRIF